MDVGAISGVGISVAISGAAIKRGEEVSVEAFAASGSAGACVAAGAASCAADIGAAALNAVGARAALRLKDKSPLITNEMKNKKVASADAKRNAGTARGVGGLKPAICGVNVKLRGARREGS